MGHTATVAQRGRGLGVTLQRGPQESPVLVDAEPAMNMVAAIDETVIVLLRAKRNLVASIAHYERTMRRKRAA